ncbi:IPT/TIG domain-containing protein [Arthrobacter pascens]|uniref:IPT/TIG domain-containing protein n=1 Tax=Arthrobacter pascens TaxID=1677 RepID=UPI00196AD596|nr:IPT/TIG domain-containing protein [Arthrobacter pascens]MBN3496359.1 IPT/TIG domain-containing protein [Arthrobacter pascens]
MTIADGLTPTSGCRYNPIDDRVYVAEISGRVSSIGMDRSMRALTRDLRGAVDLAITSDGLAAFVAIRDGRLYLLDLSSPGSAPQLVAKDLGEVAQIAWVPGRATVWAVQTGPEGRLIEIAPATGDVSRLSDALDNGVGLAARADGSLAYVSRRDEILAVDVSGGLISPLTGSFESPGRLTWTDDSETLLLHAEPGTGGRVQQIDSAGVTAALFDAGDVQPTSIGMVRDRVVISGMREVIVYDLAPVPPRPVVTALSPLLGHGGDVLVLSGSGFGDWATPVTVEVGGVPATVLEHSDHRLRVLTHPDTRDGSVTVRVGPNILDAGTFILNESPGYFDDGPPLVLADIAPAPALGEQGLPKSGGAVFVALVNPADLASPPTGARTTIDDRWNGPGDSVATYYDQASYSKSAVSGAVTAGWKTLSGNLLDYHWTSELKQKVDASGNPVYDSNGHAEFETDASGNPVAQTNPDGTVKVYNNFWNNPRLVAEAVQLYKTEIAASQPDMIAVTCYTGGKFTRGWGNMSAKTFTFSAAGLSINETLSKDTPYITVHEDADWGRLAHETGHNIIDPKFAAGAHLGEDIYGSDLIDPAEATAAAFDIMGSHDAFHALFSGSNLENLGWFADAHASNPNDENLSGQTNIGRVKWDRNPRTLEVELQAHGTTENTVQGRYHVLKIIVTPSLSYYVEVRQRPGTTGLVFDPGLPLGGAPNPNQGGVIVTRVLLDSINNNQQTRFITLAHAPNVLRTGSVVVDPLRDLKITVLDDNVQAWPLICKVKIEWAQNVPDDPAGKFDLRIQPWDDHYQTPDIWIDRKQDGVYDQPMDAEGRPKGSGDKPLVNAKNDFYCRIRNDGTDEATNVLVTFYSVTPPGVGDNGSWAPIKTATVGSIASGSSFDSTTVWVPQVGEHTCLKVVATHQLGEVTGGNNQAQENIAEFDLSAGSPVHPLTLPVAVRNPSAGRRRIHLRARVTGRSDGYLAQIPHQWVWVDGHGERMVDVVIAAPDDVGRYVEQPPIDVRIDGFLERRYTETADGIEPGEFLSPIGGLTARCKAKFACRVRIWAESGGGTVAVGGDVSPGGSGIPVLIVITGGPDGDVVVDETVTGPSGSFDTQFELRAVLDRNPELDGRDLDVVAVVDGADFVAGMRSNSVRIRP